MAEGSARRSSRSTDRGRIAAFWGRYGRDVTTVVAVGLAAYSVTVSINTAEDAKQASSDAKTASTAALRAANASKHAVAQIKVESKERINETCRIQEAKQKADVDQLRQLYKYLAGLTPAELTQPLNRAVLTSMPQAVREAQLDDAPAYCDEPNVGLPEPDPVLPKPPKGLPMPVAGKSARR